MRYRSGGAEAPVVEQSRFEGYDELGKLLKKERCRCDRAGDADKLHAKGALAGRHVVTEKPTGDALGRWQGDGEGCVIRKSVRSVRGQAESTQSHSAAA